MRITYGEPADVSVDEGRVTALNALDIPEGKCLFRLFVEKPKEAKIVINDVEQDSVIVDEMEVVHWCVTCDGYKPSVGEFQVINSIGFTLSLVPAKPKRIKSPYVKWSINDKYGYKVEVLDLSDQESSDLPLPTPEGYDNCYLYAFGGNIFWREIKLENLLSLHSYDSGKYLTYDKLTGFSFKAPLPDLPEEETKVFVLKCEDEELRWVEDTSIPEFPVEQLDNKNFYMLTYKDGQMKWVLNPFTLPKLPDETYFQGDKYVLSYKDGEVSWSDGTNYWGSVKGDISEQQDLMDKIHEKDPEVEDRFVALNERVDEVSDSAQQANDGIDRLSGRATSLEMWVEDEGVPAARKADEAKQWVDNFGVEADGFVFTDGKLKYREGFVFPDGEDIANIHREFDTFKNRYATFEAFLTAQVQMRLTSPDFSQLSDVEYRVPNFFFNSKKRYLHIESLELGSTIEVYKPLINEESGSIQGPDLANGPVLTVYKNLSGEGDVRLIELTTGFFYKVSDEAAFNLKFVGELPYGEYPG